ncbi:MAG TPA: hypothetical protein PLW48_08085 [Alphaproteobacteria bacterium]|nr:hypothetical protein [Rhodospirillaceae bacterium]HRJ67083.1 hypothetical protein [Alphaproteobacteria bacterium]
MHNIIAMLILTVMSVVPSVYAMAAPANSGDSAAQRVIERVFSEAERAVIEEFYLQNDKENAKGKGGKKKGKGLPPGLAKKDRLPPGLEKQLKKNGTLPPGLARNDLPLALQNKLYPPKAGTKRILVGRDIVLIDTKTDLILDIIHDVVRASRL